MRDRTAQTGPLTTGQQIVAWWETSTSASEPADLAERIDAEIVAERERCAKICDHYVTPHGRAGSAPDFLEGVAKQLAAAIRKPI